MAQNFRGASPGPGISEAEGYEKGKGITARSCLKEAQSRATNGFRLEDRVVEINDPGH